MRSTSAMLDRAPYVIGTLLHRFERDVHALSEYLIAEERQKQLERIFFGVRYNLVGTSDFSDEVATAMARQYVIALELRIQHPQHFNPALRPRQPSDAPRRGNSE